MEPRPLRDTEKGLLRLAISLCGYGVPILVKGGMVSLFYLGDKARPTADLDLVMDTPVQEFEGVLNAHCRVERFEILEKSARYYEDFFTAKIIENEDTYSLDGIAADYFAGIELVEYRVGELTFFGVPVEYVIAEKVLSLLQENRRPYKHLVDLYGFASLEDSALDVGKIRYYLKLINDSENRVRERLGIRPLKFANVSLQTRDYSGQRFLPTLQAGITLEQNALEENVHDWLRKKVEISSIK